MTEALAVIVLVDVDVALAADEGQIAGDVVLDEVTVGGDLHLLDARALHEFAMQPCPKRM